MGKTLLSIRNSFFSFSVNSGDRIKLTCKYCGKTFRGRKNRLFCSQSCSNRYHAEKRKNNTSHKRITTSVFPADKDFIETSEFSYKTAINKGCRVLRSEYRSKQFIKDRVGFIYLLLFGTTFLLLTPVISIFSLKLLVLLLGVFFSVVGLWNLFLPEFLEWFLSVFNGKQS